MSNSSKDAEQEPSIEEILMSIRQIISDDDEEETTAKAPDEKPDDPVAVPEEDEGDVVDLVNRVDAPSFADEVAAAEDEMIEEEPVIEIDLKEPEPEPEEDILDDFNNEAEEFEEVSSLDSLPEDDFSSYPVPDDVESIFTEKAEKAAYDGFKELAAKTAIDRISGVTIEEIVRDEIRPMLRGWLDANLPSIVERLVREELERVSRRALED